MPKIFIGTSGWFYDHWRGYFYPKEKKKENLFSYYSNFFDTVEINNTFYRLPSEKTFEKWLAITPRKFVYAIKASRYITHIKKLKDSEKATKKFFKTIELLGLNLGPILFQLPPNWSINTERLNNFIGKLPKKYKYVFEFRDKSWITEEVKIILKENNCAFCIYNLEKYITPKWVTADFVYIRLHGPEKLAYKGKYSEDKLKDWAKDIKDWQKQGKDVFCYFDNDEKGYAPINAKQLKILVSTS